MGMTAKRYDIVALSIARTRQMFEDSDSADMRQALNNLEFHLSVEFQNENPMFNPETFARKCRAGEEKS